MTWARRQAGLRARPGRERRAEARDGDALVLDLARALGDTRELLLEFYIVLEMGEHEYPGRLTESFFAWSGLDDRVGYVNRIAGDFTLEARRGRT